MPGPVRQLSHRAARDHIARRCLSPTPPAQRGRVGLECEWHVRPVDDPTGVVPLAELRARIEELGVLPGGSRVTYEPGGQLELSSPPATGLADAIARVALDRDRVVAALGVGGVELVACGVDPLRPPRRQLRAPRYDAMEAFFDGDGPEGRVMMTRTASVQVNLDLGADEAAVARRWRQVHGLGPTLAAAFANSPLVAGRPTGWCSSRLATWFAMDRSRTAPADEAGAGPGAWIDYALDARVMLVRRGERYLAQRDGLTFAGWLARGHELGWPTLDDLDYHLTTLFPPVRPRGWLELRFLDALPEPWWRVAAAAATVGLDDEAGAEQAERAGPAAGHLWCEAARGGLAHPALHAAARSFFAGLPEACRRVRADASTTDACAEFYDRYVAPGRCPALDWGTNP